MIKKVQNTLLLLTVAMAIPMLFSGCNKKVHFPNCKKDADCRVDGRNGVCHMGKCEECVDSSQCSDNKQCISNRCETPCHVDADCGLNRHCEDQICHNDCSDSNHCSGGRVCTLGRCLSQKFDPNSVAGCENIEKIHFGFNEHEITPATREQAQKLASCMQANPGFTVLIGGHTDDRGTTAYNIALGERRANAVKRYLTEEKGIASNRITTQSYGETMPIQDEKSEQAWYQNRRAEFKLEANN